MQNYTLFVELQQVTFTIQQVITGITAAQVSQSENKQFFVQAINCVMSRETVAAPLVITLRSIDATTASTAAGTTSAVMLTYVVVYSVPIPGDISNYTLTDIVNEYFFQYVYFLTQATTADAFMPVVNALCTYATTKACYPNAHSRILPKFNGPNQVTPQVTIEPTTSGQHLAASSSAAVKQNSIIFSVVAVGGFMCLLCGACYGISVYVFGRKPGAPEDPSETLDAFASTATNRNSVKIRLDDQPDSTTRSSLGRLSLGRASAGGPGGVAPFEVPEDLFEETGSGRNSITNAGQETL